MGSEKDVEAPKMRTLLAEGIEALSKAAARSHSDTAERLLAARKLLLLTDRWIYTANEKLKKNLAEAWNHGYCSLGDDLGWEPGAWPDSWNDLKSHTQNPYDEPSSPNVPRAKE